MHIVVLFITFNCPEYLVTAIPETNGKRAIFGKLGLHTTSQHVEYVAYLIVLCFGFGMFCHCHQNENECATT